MSFESPPLSLRHLIKTYLESSTYKVDENDRKKISSITKKQTLADIAGLTWIMGIIVIDVYLHSARFRHLKGLNKLLPQLQHFGFHTLNVIITFGARSVYNEKSIADTVDVLSKYDPEVKILKYRNHLLHFDKF